MKVILVYLILFIPMINVCAQAYTLQNQYAKMKKKYPFIVPYEPSDDGLVVCKDVVYRVVIGKNETPRTLCFDSFSLPVYDVSKRRPLLVFVHGGGWSSGSKEMDHPMAIAMARKGYVCVCIDYRKSGEALYPAAVEDVYSAVAIISKSYSVPLNLDGRVCLVGSSAGGQLASLVGCNDNYLSVTDRVVCGGDENGDVIRLHVDKVIDIDGILAFIHEDSAEGRDEPGKLSSATRWFGEPMDVGGRKGYEASPLFHVNANSAEYTFIVGTQKRFTAGIRQMTDSLRLYGHKAEIYRIFRNEDVEGKDDVIINTLPETTTPHCFWLFTPWAEQVIDVMERALSDWK